MTHALMVVPTGAGSGLTTVVLGLFHAFARQGIRVHFFKPIGQPNHHHSEEDRTISLLQASCSVAIAKPIDIREAEHLVSEGQGDQLLEEIVARYQTSCHKEIDLVLIEGMVHTQAQPYATRVNCEIARALDAKVILVAAPNNDTLEAFEDHIDIAARAYGGVGHEKVVGCVLNKLSAPLDQQGQLMVDEQTEQLGRYSLSAEDIYAKSTLFNPQFPILGALTWNPLLAAPRVSDLVTYLNAVILHKGEVETRRVQSVSLCAFTVASCINILKPGTLVVVPGDRDDLILATCLAAMNGIELAAVMLTGGYEPKPEVMRLCGGAMAAGLPIFSVQGNRWQLALMQPTMEYEIPADDLERINLIRELSAEALEPQWLQSFVSDDREPHMSPPAFRYQLIERARQADKHIVLPEGNEPRTIKAANVCAERGIARCTLLGNPDEIQLIAHNQGLTLSEGVSIVDPEKLRAEYIPRLVELRRHKGMTDVIAAQQLEDNVVLGTLMLEQGDVDGLVSGAVHTTANTIRPPLQLIKAAPGCSLVSSVFFMCLPDQVLVYGDCAINPDPSAEELADIAIQSADSAAAFGITPRVAMISYSTGSSGQGADVEKVRKATELAQSRRPDLLIDGPMQYDAAVMESVARSKAPNSAVAGKATVLIFPDLNTGNTTYKAVQRSADVISIGPMLQGMGKPVNDLSRGALVDDIVFTIALTAIQAAQVPMTQQASVALARAAQAQCPNCL